MIAKKLVARLEMVGCFFNVVIQVILYECTELLDFVKHLKLIVWLVTEKKLI